MPCYGLVFGPSFCPTFFAPALARGESLSLVHCRRLKFSSRKEVLDLVASAAVAGHAGLGFSCSSCGDCLGLGRLRPRSEELVGDTLLLPILGRFGGRESGTVLGAVRLGGGTEERSVFGSSYLAGRALLEFAVRGLPLRGEGVGASGESSLRQRGLQSGEEREEEQRADPRSSAEQERCKEEEEQGEDRSNPRSKREAASPKEEADAAPLKCLQSAFSQ